MTVRGQSADGRGLRGNEPLFRNDSGGEAPAVKCDVRNYDGLEMLSQGNLVYLRVPRNCLAKLPAFFKIEPLWPKETLSHGLIR